MSLITTNQILPKDLARSSGSVTRSTEATEREAISGNSFQAVLAGQGGASRGRRGGQSPPIPGETAPDRLPVQSDAASLMIDRQVFGNRLQSPDATAPPDLQGGKKIPNDLQGGKKILVASPEDVDQGIMKRLREARISHPVKKISAEQRHLEVPVQSETKPRERSTLTENEQLSILPQHSPSAVRQPPAMEVSGILNAIRAEYSSFIDDAGISPGLPGDIPGRGETDHRMDGKPVTQMLSHVVQRQGANTVLPQTGSETELNPATLGSLVGVQISGRGGNEAIPDIFSRGSARTMGATGTGLQADAHQANNHPVVPGTAPITERSWRDVQTSDVSDGTRRSPSLALTDKRMAVGLNRPLDSSEFERLEDFPSSQSTEPENRQPSDTRAGGTLNPSPARANGIQKPVPDQVSARANGIQNPVPDQVSARTSGFQNPVPDQVSARTSWFQNPVPDGFFQTVSKSDRDGRQVSVQLKDVENVDVLPRSPGREIGSGNVVPQKIPADPVQRSAGFPRADQPHVPIRVSLTPPAVSDGYAKASGGIPPQPKDSSDEGLRRPGQPGFPTTNREAGFRSEVLSGVRLPSGYHKETQNGAGEHENGVDAPQHSTRTSSRTGDEHIYRPFDNNWPERVSSEPERLKGRADRSGGSERGVRVPATAVEAETLFDKAAPAIPLALEGELAKPGVSPGPGSAQGPVQSNPGSIANSLGLRIVAHTQAGDSKFELQMDPPELGRLAIAMETVKGQRTRVDIRVELPEVLDLLQRDTRELIRVLGSAGIDVRDRDITLGLQSPDSGTSFKPESDSSSEFQHRQFSPHGEKESGRGEEKAQPSESKNQPEVENDPTQRLSTEQSGRTNRKEGQTGLDIRL